MQAELGRLLVACGQARQTIVDCGGTCSGEVADELDFAAEAVAERLGRPPDAERGAAALAAAGHHLRGFLLGVRLDDDSPAGDALDQWDRTLAAVGKALGWVELTKGGDS
jgi:hypothetical protein